MSSACPPGFGRQSGLCDGRGTGEGIGSRGKVTHSQNVYRETSPAVTPDSGSEASPDQQEPDITVDFRPERFPMKGLWLRVRRAWVDQDGLDGIDVGDFRVILNYGVPVL